MDTPPEGSFALSTLATALAEAKEKQEEDGDTVPGEQL